MVRFCTTSLTCLLTLIIFGQSKTKIDKVIIDYRSSFGGFGKYEINLVERYIYYQNDVIFLNPDGSPIINSKKLNHRRTIELKNLINSIHFELLDTITGCGFDGAWLFIDTFFSSGNNRKYIIWDEYASEQLRKLFTILRKRYK